MECRIIFVEKMRYVSMHHPIFSEEGIFEGKNQAKFSFVVQLLAGYIYVYVAVMAMSGAVSVGDALCTPGRSSR